MLGDGELRFDQGQVLVATSVPAMEGLSLSDRTFADTTGNDPAPGFPRADVQNYEIIVDRAGGSSANEVFGCGTGYVSLGSPVLSYSDGLLKRSRVDTCSAGTMHEVIPDDSWRFTSVLPQSDCCRAQG